jgi:hypothetical protein
MYDNKARLNVAPNLPIELNSETRIIGRRLVTVQLSFEGRTYLIAVAFLLIAEKLNNEAAHH